MPLDPTRLRNTPPESLDGVHPWLVHPTWVAANFLKIHVKTLLKRNREGIGPNHVPRDKYLGNQLYWQLGTLQAWWEKEVYGDEGRNFQQICQDWIDSSTPTTIKYECEQPVRPNARQLRRRERIRPVRRNISDDDFCFK